MRQKKEKNMEKGLFIVLISYREIEGWMKHYKQICNTIFRMSFLIIKMYFGQNIPVLGVTILD